MRHVSLFIAVAALCAAPHAVGAQTGTAPFCLQTVSGTRCVFGTIGECEAARGNTGDTVPGQCMTRTDAQGTTGLGTERPPPSVKRREQPSAGPYFPTEK
jgi:hypothetical protein